MSDRMVACGISFENVTRLVESPSISVEAVDDFEVFDPAVNGGAASLQSERGESV